MSAPAVRSGGVFQKAGVVTYLGMGAGGLQIEESYGFILPAKQSHGAVLSRDLPLF